MSTFVTREWTAVAADGLPRRYTRSGPYQAYIPSHLTGRPITLHPATRALTEQAHQLARESFETVRHAGLGQIGDLLVRSEASASSLIEGYEPSARAVAVADFVHRGHLPALTVARNLHAVRESLHGSTDPSVPLVTQACDLQAVIVPAAAGLRTQPVWIGGPSPLEAHYNAPPHEVVPELLDDLASYLASHPHTPVVAAALAHAQFETIHPFTDGNGRAGRVLLGMILSRDGLTPGVALPVSTELFRDRTRYYAALDAYRAGDDDAIITVVADAVCAAAERSVALASAVTTWQNDHTAALEAFLRARSATGRVRRGTAHRLIQALPSTPVLDAATVVAAHDVSDNAARAALESLADAGIVRRDRKTDRTRTLYVAADLLDLIVGDARG
jgi:Fic/DOC family protein